MLLQYQYFRQFQVWTTSLAGQTHVRETLEVLCTRVKILPITFWYITTDTFKNYFNFRWQSQPSQIKPTLYLCLSSFLIYNQFFSDIWLLYTFLKFLSHLNIKYFIRCPIVFIRLESHQPGLGRMGAAPCSITQVFQYGNNDIMKQGISPESRPYFRDIHQGEVLHCLD